MIFQISDDLPPHPTLNTLAPTFWNVLSHLSRVADQSTCVQAGQHVVLMVYMCEYMRHVLKNAPVHLHAHSPRDSIGALLRCDESDEVSFTSAYMAKVRRIGFSADVLQEPSSITSDIWNTRKGCILQVKVTYSYPYSYSLSYSARNLQSLLFKAEYLLHKCASQGSMPYETCQMHCRLEDILSCQVARLSNHILIDSTKLCSHTGGTHIPTQEPLYNTAWHVHIHVYIPGCIHPPTHPYVWGTAEMTCVPNGELLHTVRVSLSGCHETLHMRPCTWDPAHETLHMRPLHMRPCTWDPCTWDPAHETPAHETPAHETLHMRPCIRDPAQENLYLWFIAGLHASTHAQLDLPGIVTFLRSNLVMAVRELFTRHTGYITLSLSLSLIVRSICICPCADSCRWCLRLFPCLVTQHHHDFIISHNCK